MALSKVDYNSLNVTAAASKALKWNSTPNGFETGDNSGSMVLIKTLTASDSATLSFVDGTSDVVLDDTYSSYVFKCINIHPETNNTSITFNGSIDAGSNYNVAKTASAFIAYHYENDSAAVLTYSTFYDMAQATGYFNLGMADGQADDNDANLCAEIWLFAPSSTTFVKHFMIITNMNSDTDIAMNGFAGGYFNTTSAIDAIQFKMTSDAIGAGIIKLYGIK